MTNVVFKETRKTVILNLPSFEGSEVELWDGLLFGQMKEISKAPDDFSRGILVLQYIIKNWNLVDEKIGIKLEVNEANLNQFPIKDLTILMEKANKILEELGKKKEESSKKQ